MNSISDLSQQLLQLILEYSINACLGLSIFIIFYIASIFFYKLINNFFKKVSPEKQGVLSLVSRAVKTMIIIIGVITSMGSIGINITALVAGLGLTGFAVGYALKDSISNLLSGVLLVLYQPFKIADKIEVAGFQGVVEKIDLRYTTLKDFTANKTILIPNTLTITKTVVVFSDEHAHK